MKLDARTVAGLTLPPGKDDAIVFDRDLAGFGVRLRQNGARVRKVWIAQYRPPGTRRTRRVTLGTIERLSPREAREAARKLLASVSLGGDPQAEKEAKRQQASRTVQATVAIYLDAKRAEWRPVSSGPESWLPGHRWS